MWVTSVQVIFPDGENKGILQASLLPYDGAHLLALGGKRVSINDIADARSRDTVLDGVLTALVAEVQRQAGQDAAPAIIQVLAHDPSKPVQARVIFLDRPPYTIPDCFALCVADSVFAGVFTTTMGEIARLAGLTISQTL